jgi:hypothetical protein
MGQLWTTGGVVLGFAVTSFSWRISREVNVGETDLVRLAPADYLNLAAMAVLTLGVFVAPLVNGSGSGELAARSLGLAMILFVGHAFSLPGHYELFSRGRRRSYEFFPLMEKVAVVASLVVAAAYVGLMVTAP